MKTIHLICLTVTLSFLFMTPILDSQEEASKQYCRLNSDQDLWSGASKHYKKVRRAEAGLLLQVIGEKNEYYRVLVPDGYSCYISIKFLDVDQNKMGVVTGNQVALRSIPNLVGDYPLIRVDRGLKVHVWERVGDWYRITAPEIAHVYVPKSQVTLVETTEALLKEVAALRGKRQKAWDGYKEEAEQNLKKKMGLEALHNQFMNLESKASVQFKGMDLDQVIKDYEKIAQDTEDPTTKKIAGIRINEIKALVEKNRLIEEAKLKEIAWRKEKKQLEKDLEKAKEQKVTASPSTHKKPGKGRIVEVIGTLESLRSGYVLKGGKSRDDVLYRIECSDGRYILGDLNGKRLLVKGRLDLNKNSIDDPALILVERIEFR